MADSEENKKTPLYDAHVAAGAKMVPFAGFLMPVQYSGIVDEHKAVRESVGLFDVSHMGEFEVWGEGSLDFLQRVMLNDVSNLEIGQAQYSGMCYDDGGMVDDLLVYRFEDKYMVVVNASNIDKDYDWMTAFKPDGVELTNRSDDVALLAVQGRNAIDTIEKLTEVNLTGVKYYHFTEGTMAGRNAIISRTGYTGEPGFELYVGSADAPVVWNALLDAGAEFDLKPTGLGARDTLRLEMGFCLYGNDIDKTTNPIEAGLGWITKLDKGEFTGSEAIRKVKEEGLSRKLTGFVMRERAIPRHGYGIEYSGESVGEVTSGTFSPSLSKGIGLGYVRIDLTVEGTEIEIDVRGRKMGATIVKPPFYKPEK